MPGPLLSSLGIVCPACDHLNPARSPRCQACGVGFGAGAPAAETSPSGSAARPPAPPVVQNVSAALARPKPPVLSPHGSSAGAHASPGPRTSESYASFAAPAPATEAPPKHAPAPRSDFVLTVVSGSARGERYPIPISGSWIGRQRGNILFPEDVFISGHHAAITVHQGRLRIRDEGTASGVFVSIEGKEAIAHGALFSIGRRLLRFLGHLQPAVAATAGGPPVYGAPLPNGLPPYGVEELLVGGRTGRAVISARPSLTIGQINCDFSFPHDDSLALAHCQLSPGSEGAVLTDLSNGMGTFMRIPPGADRPLKPGDRIRLGQQILQVENA